MTHPTPDTLRDLVKRHLHAASTSGGIHRENAYRCAADAAGRLIDALDNGAPFPDAWQPFARPQTDEPDPRSIAGDLRQALTEWRALNQEKDDGDDFIDAGNSIAESARALLDALAAPAQDTIDAHPGELRGELAATRAKLSTAYSAIDHLKTCRAADAEKIDRLQHRLDAAIFTAQDHHDALETIERLVRERDAATAEYNNQRTSRKADAERYERRLATMQANFDGERASVHRLRAALAAAMQTIEQAAAAPTDHHAAVLTHAADTVHHTTTTTTGDRADLRRELKERAHLHAANLKQGRDVPGETRRLTSVILALGMTTFGADRKADDYADRLEGRLRDAAHLLQ